MDSETKTDLQELTLLLALLAAFVTLWFLVS